MTPYQKNQPDYKRLMAAVFLAAFVLTGWQAMVEWPRRQKLAHYTVEQSKKREELQQKEAVQSPVKDDAEENPALTREQRIASSPRIAIESDTLHGSIDLKGARFDDLTLAKYRETTDPDSPDVLLFSPNGDEDAYFAQIGWVSPDGATRVPDQHTLWQADRKTLAAGDTVHLHWDNGDGVTFILAVSLDSEYMFSIAQRVENHANHPVTVLPYAYINRAVDIAAAAQLDQREHRHRWQRGNYSGSSNLHSGPVGVMDGVLNEATYKELHDKGNKTYDDASGWFGITDQYWLSALIPEGRYKTTFSHYSKNATDRYQVDYLGGALTVNQGGSADDNLRLFAGAKELGVLDYYENETGITHWVTNFVAKLTGHNTGDNTAPPIPLFDHAVDFGLFYFLAKPLLLMLICFFAVTGNVGAAIMLLTVVVRACLYPLANKSFKATAQMRKLQPQMLKIRERHVDDAIALNKEMLELYKREKVNPASGCLPIILQMPVFFALYKVLYVSIEMRHAPFFGWIKDLSAADPSNIFTLFGLVNWPVPGFLHLGILPILMCATMVFQMRQQPKPADPVQAKMMTYMPYFFLFVFSKMPAGLVLYWTWSNTISIAQQKLITSRHGAKATA